MNKTLLITILGAFAILEGSRLTSGQDAPAKPATAGPRYDYRDRYSILADQNMFLRDRRRRRNDFEDRRRDTPPPRREEENYALRGVVLEDGEYRAYLENLSSYSILRLSIGDPVARGKLTQIEIDAAEYEQNGQYTWVEVGHNLTGTMATPAYSPSSTPSTQPAGSSDSGAAAPAGAPIDPNDPNLTVEQKMRLRRMQQTGGGGK